MRAELPEGDDDDDDTTSETFSEDFGCGLEDFGNNLEELRSRRRLGPVLRQSMDTGESSSKRVPMFKWEQAHLVEDRCCLVTLGTDAPLFFLLRTQL